MNNYASATIEGFVTKIPTTKSTKTGKKVCTFSLAVNHYTSDENAPRVSYIDVETWEKMADFCNQNVIKGKRMIVMGSLKQDRWQNDDGKQRSRLKIVGKEVRFIESRKKEEIREENFAK